MSIHLPYLRGHEWFLTITRNMSFWHQGFSTAAHKLHLKKFGIDASLDFIILTIDSTETHCFMYNPNHETYTNATMATVATKEGLAKFKKKYIGYGEKLLKALWKCRKKLTLQTWNEFIAAFEVYCATLMPTGTIGRRGVELMIQKLKDLRYNEKEIPSIIATVTYPNEHTPLFRSQLDLLQIGKEVQKNKINLDEQNNKLQIWLATYENIPVNWCEEPWTMKDAEEQLATLMKKDCAEEIIAMEANHVKKVKEASTLLKKIDNEEITMLAHAMAEATYLNEYRKNVFSRVSLEYRPIFRQLAEKVGSNNWKDIWYLTPAESTSILEGKKIPIQEIKNARASVGMYTDDTGKPQLLPDKETQILARYIEELHGTAKIERKEKEYSVKGFSANKGIVIGKVKVVLSSATFHKLEEGDILVTTMTSVDFVPIMKKAAAFVTNEGGITSHASIVAREMNKPCIIGTKTATQVFKDGDIVEVNANTGTVKIIS